VHFSALCGELLNSAAKPAISQMKRSRDSDHDTSAREKKIMPVTNDNHDAISNTDSATLQWAADVLGETIASLGLPAVKPEGRGVGIHLLEMTAEPITRGTQRQRLQLSLKYLIAAWGDAISAAHDLLGKLLFGAMQEPDFEIEPETPGIQFWQAHSLPPQPCFVIRRRVWLELAPKPVKLVRKSIVESVPVQSLQGVVYGPGGIPLCDAVVRLPALNRSTRTGRHGEFNFETVPPNNLGQLRVEAKGRELAIDLSAVAAPSPLAIHFEMEV